MTQQLTATGVVALFRTTKKERLEFVNNVIESAKEGDVNPLDLHLQIKCMEDIIKGITSSDEYKDLILTEAEKYGSKSFEYNNSKIERKEVGVKYDYSNCNDEVFNELQRQAEKLNDKIKQREKFLRNAPLEGTTVVDEETGLTVTIYPPAKTSTTTIAVTLK